MSTKHFLIAYAFVALVFLTLDAAWLGFMGSRLYQPRLGHLLAGEVVWSAAALFYALYIAGIVAFAVRPGLLSGSATTALGWGALLGLLAYATYDLTNQATLKAWSTRISVIDIGWGTLLTTAGALAGVLAWRWAARLAG